MSKTDMYGLPYEVAVCAECDLVYARRRLDAESSTAFYNDEYRPLDRGRDRAHTEYFELQYTKYTCIQSFLDEAEVKLPAAGLVVEIGCGAGGTLAAFRDRGYQVLGFDPGREYVQWGVAECALDLRVGDLETAARSMDWGKTPPDLVIYEQVLEHIADPIAELTRIQRILGPASLVFVGVPGIRNIDIHYDSDFRRYLQFPHLIHFDLASLTRIASIAGLSLVHGNELVQAAFKVRSDETQSAPPQFRAAHEPMLEYLGHLERRWRRKRRLEFVQRLPRRAWNRFTRLFSFIPSRGLPT
ncbi:MAG TPA: class I SAM-dependent methyltransferase [Vicinamibacterales bacterium]|nr:class I SAM-dependent methyltransferase [Vicinamibacterales bacterium]